MIDTPDPDPFDVDGVIAEMEDALADEAEGYTDRVRAQEAAVAEADRLRELPTTKVLARQQALTELVDANELATAELVTKLQAAGERQRAKLAAKAAKAAALRQLATDPNIEALRLTHLRRRRVAMLWATLLGCMATTAVTVQLFVSASAPAWSPSWVVGWLVDPALSLLVVALLLVRGDLAGKDALNGRRAQLTTATEVGALLACLVMNTAPEIESRAYWGLIVGHVVMPLVATAAALMIPAVQQRYQARIDALNDAGSKIKTDLDRSRVDRVSDLQKSTLDRPFDRGVDRGRIEGSRGRSIEELRLALAAAVEADPNGVDLTSAESIRRALKCAPAKARQLRNEFTERPSE